MKKTRLFALIFTILLSMSVISCAKDKNEQTSPDKVIKGTLKMEYPLAGSLFPADIVAPTFTWKYDGPGTVKWHVRLQVGKKELYSNKTDQSKWKPEPELWQKLKDKYIEQDITVTVQAKGANTLQDSTRIKISKDKADAKIFYRDVPLPFIYAFRNLETINWRLGDISTEEPSEILMEKLPICGNCHSFSMDGGKFAMDVDYANDKGSYVITDIEKVTSLTWEKIITWSTYKREDGDYTFGLLSQISPDGRYAVSTVKDHSVFVPKENLFYSQLFFPIKGILAVYDTVTKEFFSLAGADDPEYVQSNPTWSPDGETIYFAKSLVFHSEEIDKSTSILIDPAIVSDFIEGRRLFKYDLYKIPFNNGKGGKAEPIPGASNNGLSNYFPKISPDGKWLVFCQANSFMLLQPDSKLYIMPTSGGEPKKMTCNTDHMNSWHSWSPNGKWLVFTSKARGAYTQLYLTHIDENGQDTPPVLIENLVLENRAINIPEFVNLQGREWEKIVDHFSNSSIFDVRIADSKVMGDDLEGALVKLDEAAKKNPKDPSIYYRRGFIKMSLGDIKEALEDFTLSIDINDKYPLAFENRAYAYTRLEQYDKALLDLDRAISLQPTLQKAYVIRGEVKTVMKKFDEAMQDFARAILIDAEDSGVYKSRGDAYFEMKKYEQALADYNKALKIEPKFHLALASRSTLKAKTGDIPGAFADLEEAIKIEPGDFNLYIYRGIMKERTGDLNGAAADFSKAAEMNPKSYKGFYRRAGARLKAKAVNDAFSDIDKAIELNPGNAVLYLTKGNFYFNQKDMRKAVTEFDKAIKLDPRNVTAHSYKGDALYVLKELPAAAAAFAEAIKLSPDNGGNYFKRGVIRLSLRQKDEGCKDLRRAKELGHKQADEFLEKYCK